MRPFVRIVVVVALVLPQSVWSQSEVQPKGQWSSVQTIVPGEKIVVQLKDGRTIKGKLNSVSVTLTLDSAENKPAAFDRDNIRQIHTDSRSLRKSILIGAAVGAGSGAALGAAVGGCGSGQFVCFGRSVTIPATAAILAIPGALTGFLFGKFGHKRVLVYQSP